MSNTYKPVSDLLNSLLSELEEYDILANDMLYTISTMIHDFRIAQKMSQCEFASFMGVTQSMISKWESGEYNFSIELLAKLCTKLGCTPKISFEFVNALSVPVFIDDKENRRHAS